MIRLPRVWVINPHGNFLPKWSPLPTPSCPDLDYVSLYFNMRIWRVCLILVQKSESQATMTRLLNEAYTAQTDAAPPPPATGRIVGHYLLKLHDFRKFRTIDMITSDAIWEPIDVHAEHADFFSLGCRHPGEVRFLSASLNVEHLRPITLARTPVDATGEFEVEVRFDDAPDSKPDGLSEWVNHQHSLYRDTSSLDIEEMLAPILKSPDGDSVFDSLKMRRLEHPLLETTPFTPADPIVFTPKYDDNEDFDYEFIPQFDCDSDGGYSP